MQRRDLVGIQYLRGIAALLVVFDHANTVIGLPKYFSSRPIALEFYGGPSGVDLFFVISGFIIAYITLDPTLLKSNISMSSFIWRRFARIMPFLWICVASYAALRFVGRDGAFEAGPYIRAVTLYPLGIVNPTQVWTLRHEFLFYIVFCTVLWIPRYRFLPLSLWLLSPLIYFSILTDSQSQYFQLIGFLFSRLNLLFGIGFIVSIIYLKKPHWFVPSISGGMLLCTILSLFYLIPFIAISYSHLSTLDVLVAGAGAAAVLYVGLRIRNEKLGLIDYLGKSLGDASYAIYLTHGIFISAITGSLSGNFPRANGFLVLAVCVAGSVVLGYVVHRFVEKPVVRLFHKHKSVTVRPERQRKKPFLSSFNDEGAS